MFKCVLPTFVLIGLFSFVICDDDCINAIQNLQNCVKSKEREKQHDRPTPGKKESDFKACFTKNGCQEPTTDKKPPSSDQKPIPTSDPKNSCKKQAYQKARELIKSCVQTKTGLNIPDRKDDGNWGRSKEAGWRRQGQKGKDEGRGDGGFSRFKSLCSTDQQRNDTKLCLKQLNLNQSRDTARQNFENVFKERCEHKRTCFLNLSTDCQKKVNETLVAACDCAKSELGGDVGAKLNEEIKKCDSDDHKVQQAHPTTFTDRVIAKACALKEESCDKPFKGSSGHLKGGNRGNDRHD